MVKVSIHPDIEYKDIASDYATYLKLWKEDRIISGFLGSDGQWESNSRLCNSFVFKLHIRTPLEPQWNKKYLKHCVNQTII